MQTYTTEIDSEVSSNDKADMHFNIKIQVTTENANTSVEEASEMMRLAKMKMYLLQLQKLD